MNNIKSLNSTRTNELSKTCQVVLTHIDDLLELQAKTHHDFLDIHIPKGIFQSFQIDSLSEKYWQKCIILNMGVMGTRLEANLALKNESDCGQINVETLMFDREVGESAYAINNVSLSPKDVRSLITYLISEFHPCSFNITESE